MYRENNRGIRDWVVFIYASELGSLTKAAKEIGSTVPAVCKSINRLEEYLDCKLFERRSNGIQLTESGLIALDRAKKIEKEFRELLSFIRNTENLISGTIRLSAPAIVCEFIANQWVSDFVRMYPNVRVFLDARERRDLNRGSPEFDDIVLRSGKIESEDLVHKPLKPLKLVICASPLYLKKHPPINHPSDLANHKSLGLHQHGLSEPILLSKGEETCLIDHGVNNNISTNNLLAMLNLVIKGKGICIATPKWLSSDYVNSGKLKILLPEWNAQEVPVWLIWRHRSKSTPLFMAFKDYIERRWNEL